MGCECCAEEGGEDEGEAEAVMGVAGWRHWGIDILMCCGGKETRCCVPISWRGRGRVALVCIIMVFFVGLGVGIAIQPPVLRYQWFIVFIYYIHSMSSS